MAYKKKTEDNAPIVKLKLIIDDRKYLVRIDKNDATVRNYTSIQKAYIWATIFFLHYLV